MNGVTLLAIGALITGGLTSIIGVMVLRRRGPVLAVCLLGQRATGRVIRVELDELSRPRPRISFPAADGREVEYREVLQVKAMAGEHLPVRYSRKNPDFATSGRLRQVLGDIFPFGIMFTVCGLVTLVGSLYVLASNPDRFFYGLAGPGVLVSIASIFLSAAAQHLSKARSRNGRAVADGVVTRLAPTKRENEYPNPWVSYATQDGRRLEYRDTALNGYGPGDEVAVYYDPDYPEFTSTGVDKAGNTGQAVFYGVVGLLSLAGAIYCIWAYLISPG
jgi:hypothetical protein